MTTSIDQAFLAQHPTSAELHAEAERLFPNGVTHDVRYFDPFGIYVDHAAGSRKWDVDGNEIIDYVMGHGALLFGHSHPLLVSAVQNQVGSGTHYGASHRGEIEWAHAVLDLLPSAEKVRFTSSGTEATMMAIRLARAFTGRPGLLRLREHFHGWNDSVVAGMGSGGHISDGGIPNAMAGLVTVVDQHDTAALGAALETKDYAAVICEPSGYSMGTGPLDPAVLHFLREKTRATGTILILDEVVTGFRAADGGVQEATGIEPDLTTLAKILAGGLPGGAVAGRADLLDQIAIPRGSDRSGAKRVAHPGTYNANPLSAAVGSAALREIKKGEAVATANARARRLTQGLNQAIRDAEVPGAAYGQASIVHILLGEDVAPPDDGFTWNWGNAGPQAIVPSTPAALQWPLRRSLLNHGFDLLGAIALVSCVHSEAEIDLSIDAFAAALSDLRREEIL
ncbi:MAG: aminotransferase class III-fold pyridoxal phosphate-dependent enzyme [Chloroflexi bacterium]|nr:aminotransferase class III-fold pyridoxal phosphate-dependent enzyme [Chloroflexota bacterium]MCZ6707111.1 aminotransferase class III-fold pyridoxal phosphate-dependent enzyme [Chloroflexota bacterium]